MIPKINSHMTDDLTYRSKKSADMTDENPEKQQIMTDHFFDIWRSGIPIKEDAYIGDNSYFIAQSKVWVSPLTYYRYEKWLKTLPSLLKELR